MKARFRLLIGGSALAAALMFAGSASAQATKQATTKTTAAATPAPTGKEIADAQAKGLVWVNTNSGVYHKSGEFYGKTKQGKFMSEADAQKAGYRAAKESAVGKKTTATTAAATAASTATTSTKTTRSKKTKTTKTTATQQ